MNKMLLGMSTLLVSLNVSAADIMIMCHFDKAAVAKIDPDLVDMHMSRNRGFLAVNGKFKEFYVVNQKVNSTVWYDVTSQSTNNISYSGLNHGGNQTYGDIQFFQRSNGTYQVTIHNMVLLKNKNGTFNSGSKKIFNDQMDNAETHVCLLQPFDEQIFTKFLSEW